MPEHAHVRVVIHVMAAPLEAKHNAIVIQKVDSSMIPFADTVTKSLP